MGHKFLVALRPVANVDPLGPLMVELDFISPDPFNGQSPGPTPPPGPPAPPPAPAPTDPVASAEQLVRLYRAMGHRPDATSTRDSRVVMLQATVLAYGASPWRMKRASSGRPVSDDVVVWMAAGPHYRRYFDLIGSAGADGWSLFVADGGTLPSDQLIVDPKTLNTIPG